MSGANWPVSVRPSMIETAHLLGIVLSLVGALSNSVQTLFIRVGTDEGNVYDAVLVVMAVNVLALLPLVGIYYYPEYGLTPRSWLSFLAAGVLGTMFGRALFYTSIERIGASRSMPIIAANALIATVLGVIVLGETLTRMHGLGVVLIFCGVATIAWETSQTDATDLSRFGLLVSLLIPFGAATAYAVEPIFVSVGLAEGTPPPVGLVIRATAAMLGFTLYLRWRGAIPRLGVMERASLRWFVLAGLANTLFLVCYYVALSIAPVNVVMPIVITNTLFVVVLSAAFMPERLERVTWPVGLAATVVVVGVALITVQG